MLFSVTLRRGECLIGVGSRQTVNRGCGHSEYRVNQEILVCRGTEKWDTGLRKLCAAKNKPVERETAKGAKYLKEASPLQNWP